MSGLADRLHQLSQTASGRCHSCMFQHTYDLPTGTRFWCRAYDREMTESERDAVRDCSSWQALRVPVQKDPGASKTLIDTSDHDHLFWRLKCYLDSLGLDLKTSLILSSGCSYEELSWIDSLDNRFDMQDPGTLADILEELAEENSDLAHLLEKALRPPMEGNA